jgi:magnesium transporter
VKHHRRRRRRKPRFRRQTPPGASPGTIAAPPDEPRPVVHVFAYGPAEYVEEQVADLGTLPTFLQRFPVTWINVEGLGDAGVIHRLGELFGLHALALEDVVNVHQRSKVEAYDQHLFIVARMMHLAESLETEQISIFLGSNFVLTFQQGHPGDCFDPVRERIRTHSGKIRSRPTDYLAYAILDAVIDSYFPIVEHYGDRLDEIDEQLSANQGPAVSARIHEVRSDLLLLRRAIRPHREALNALVRDEHSLVSSETRVFLRDCYDHTVQLIELLEVYRETCIDLRDYFVSLVSQRMNQVMKVLTVIATIFMPLSFIAGVYGMNFNTLVPGNMPELNLPYGYFLALGGMASVAIGLLLFFYRNRWIGSRRDDGNNNS